MMLWLALVRAYGCPEPGADTILAGVGPRQMASGHSWTGSVPAVHEAGHTPREHSDA